jgi:hypothetical protein
VFSFALVPEICAVTLQWSHKHRVTHISFQALAKRWKELEFASWS